PTMPCSLGRVPVRNVDCTEQVTAGVIVRMGALAPDRANAARLGVSAPSMAGVRPTTLMTAVGCTLPPGERRIAAQDGVGIELLGDVDGRPRLQLRRIKPARLAKKRNRVVPDNLLNC